MSTVALQFARFTPEDRCDWLKCARSTLSDSELERVAATAATHRQAQHAIGRAMIRLAGARESGHAPNLIAIELSEAGKPQLADTPDLHVSVAHSGGVVVMAVSRACPVGVDVEPALARARPGQHRRLAERLFSDAEVASLRGMSDATFADWFSSAWTVKEAVGKALGTGMIPALSGAVVERLSHGLSLTAVWAGPPAERWTVHQLTAPDGSEKIAVALPLAGVALESLSQITLQAFSRACSRDA